MIGCHACGLPAVWEVSAFLGDSLVAGRFGCGPHAHDIAAYWELHGRQCELVWIGSEPVTDEELERESRTG